MSGDDFDEIDYTAITARLLAMSPVQRRGLRYMVQLMTDQRKKNFTFAIVLLAIGGLFAAAAISNQNPMILWGVAVVFFLLGVLAALKITRIL